MSSRNAGTTRARLGTVRDVLAGEGGLVHGGAQIAGIDRPHREGGELGRQHGTEVLERRLAGAVAAPALVGLHRGVRSHVEHARVRRVEQKRQRVLERAPSGATTLTSNAMRRSSRG